MRVRMWLRVAALTVLTLQGIARVQGQFDWGGGCAGGSGAFETELKTKGSIQEVGPIPQGKWNVRIRLVASSDVDIQLYDSANNQSFREGKVRWPNTPHAHHTRTLHAHYTPHHTHTTRTTHAYHTHTIHAHDTHTTRKSHTLSRSLSNV